MFEAFSFGNIMERLLDRVRDDVDKREGSIIYDALAPAALELETAYIMLDYALNQGFADTAERDFLILRARERGIEPYPAAAAVLKGVFSPADAAVSGKRFSLGELNYTAGEALAGEAGAYRLVCEAAGAAGSRQLGTLIPIDYVEGLESGAATAVLIPGEDEEETEALRARYFASFGAEAFGGNVADYRARIGALEGVGGVRVAPAWNGGGTVLCLVLDAGFAPASPALVESVQEAVDPRGDGGGLGIAPIGHVVTVQASQAVTVDVSAALEFAGEHTWANTLAAIREALEGYLLELRRAWKDEAAGTDTVVRARQIESRLLALEGVVDVAAVRLNGTAGNLTLSGDAVPVLGEVINGANG